MPDKDVVWQLQAFRISAGRHIEVELPFLDELQRDDGGDRLGD